MRKPSEYETRALEQIHEWKNPSQSWIDRAASAAAWPLDKAGEAVLSTPGLGLAIQTSCSGVLGVVNDASQWSVRAEAIVADYQENGHPEVKSLANIVDLDISAIDRAIGWLDSKYEGLALVGGTVSGGASVLTPAAALVAIPVDVVALVALNLRAVGEHATYCGFDVSLPQERLFALNVLALASSPYDASKQQALSHLVRVARDVALRKAWTDLEKHAAVQGMQGIAKALGVRLTKAKLAQFIPVAGAVVGGGFNAYYTDKVCKAAFYLYRERLLAEKYGAENIEVVVDPVESLDTVYDEPLS